MNHVAFLPCHGSACTRDHVQGVGAWAVRVFHAAGDPRQTRRLTITGDGIAVTLLPSKGLSVLGAEIEGIPILWEPPLDHLPDPDLVDLAGSLLMRGDLVAGGRWIECFMAGVEMLGLENWGVVGQNEEGLLLTLHGNVSNIPVTSVEVTVDAERIVIDGLFLTYDMSSILRPSVAARPRFLVEKRVVLDGARGALYLEDRITNLSGVALTPDWGYHVQLRPRPGCRYLLPSSTVSQRRGAPLEEAFETWQPVGASEPRQEHDYVHSGLATGEVFPDGSVGVRTLLRYRDGSGIAVCIPRAPFTMSWSSAGGSNSEEFRRPEDPGTPLFVRGWNGVGPEIGASDLDHQGNGDPEVEELSLQPGQSRKLQFSFRPVDLAEAGAIESEMPPRSHIPQ